MTARTWTDGSGLPLNAGNLNGVEADITTAHNTANSHAARHAQGGADPVTPGSIGAANASHTHDASDIVSGTIPPAHLGTGSPDGTTALFGDGTWKVPQGLTIGTVSEGAAAATITGAYPQQLNLTIPTGSEFGRVYLGFPGNGSYLEKAQFCFSPDGHRVTAGNNNPVFTDGHTGGSFRDPSLLKVGSTWFCAYTVDNGNLKNFAVIKSTDFVNWSTVATVDVSAATSINQCWAPELVQDTNGDIYAFFTNVTATGGQSIWYVKATDPTGLTTWSAPTALAWTTSPGNIWDAAFVYDSVNLTWHMFYAYAGYIQRATSSTLTGTWTTDKTGDWAGWQAAVGGSTWTLEAPEVMLDGSTWRIYFDPYTTTPSETHPGYYYSESADLTTWSTPVLVSKPASFPPGHVLRHGAWVKLTTAEDMELAIAAVSSGFPLQPHAEFNGTVSAASGAVVNVGNPPIVSQNSNNNVFITCSGSGIFVPAVSGVYDLRGSFSITSSSGVTRTFAQLTDAQNSDAVLLRTPGAAEDNWQLNAPKVSLTGGHQYRVQVFQQSSQNPATINCTVAFTYVGRTN